MLRKGAEKESPTSLPPYEDRGNTKWAKSHFSRILLWLFTAFSIWRLLLQPLAIEVSTRQSAFTDDAVTDLCPQVTPWDSNKGDLPIPPSPLQLARLLSGAVQVNTSVYDDDPTVAERPDYWEVTFAPFHQYLRDAFPLSHTDNRVSLEVINKHALLYRWKGSENSLLPIIFMAHQDVVPVESDTLNRWTHPPFSGYIDEKQGVVYGRGAGDDKASLVALLASFESLLKTDYTPRRSIVLSFGFDEETRGVEGGEALARRIEEIYGRHDQGRGAMIIVDEGEGVDDSFGIRAAMPAVAEKGYLDVRISVQAKGGHSSEPPAHTSIGILSKLISAIEDHPPYPTMAMREDGPNVTDSPGLKKLLCLSDSPAMKGTFLGTALQRLIREREKLKRKKQCSCLWHRMMRSCQVRGMRRHDKLDRARKDVIKAAQEAGFKETFATTQAMDLIKGGTKVNALPEVAQSVLNLRINVEATVQSERDRLMSVVDPVVKRVGCRLDQWGEAPTRPGNKTVCVVTLSDAFDSALEPAPITPIEGEQSAPFRLLSSVIRRVWQGDSEGEAVRIVPTLMEGNTDTKSYHNISRHIFRFSPGSFEKMEGPKDGGIHTIDERVQIDALTKGSRFYTSLMKAVQ